MEKNYKDIEESQQTLMFSKDSGNKQYTSNSCNKGFQYKKAPCNTLTTLKYNFDNMAYAVAEWFLSMSSMSNKKLQKLCYYAYCWFIVLFNDIEYIEQSRDSKIQTLWDEHFQAWIHGPVLPSLYRKYKSYGWHDIPKIKMKPNFPTEIEGFLQEVWDAYACYSADELEAISHEETPWRNARKNLGNGEACSNEISDIDILEYYSSLG